MNMRLRRQIQLVALLLAPLLSGCLPATWPEMPALKGRVVNSEGQAASGAKVKIAPKDGTSDVHAVELTTDRMGRFQRGEDVRFGFAVLIPLDLAEPAFIATARLNGLQSEPVNFGNRIVNPHYLGITNLRETIDLGTLVLHPPDHRKRSTKTSK